MSSAIELIVESFIVLKDKQSLVDLRMHRRRLAVDLKAMTGFDPRLSITEVERDIEVIEAGLNTLAGPVS